MSEQIYAGTAQYNLIYIFSIPDEAHKGYLKIGEHSFSATTMYMRCLIAPDTMCIDSMIRIVTASGIRLH